ncbi:chromosomal replication initiator protein DnaA [Verrucomicrobiaceae bacterium N1E253]|uniref:Chromosomal replication initiator protein DnaA n=1 Tax=Oceaniferula marina TaxID=2748318 RepID=A0A851GA00_9BACT|nr:chromosomal replication initiator protein DnaA [Oceaniferula marina]NWK54039.1 chromosomal replication initiator protein DnaA [Oceaniferula marina]
MNQASIPTDDTPAINDDLCSTLVEDMKQLWESVSGALKGLVSGDAFSRWFLSAELVDMNETEAVLAVESDMHQVWIETNYMPEVQTAFSQVSEMPRKVRVVVADEQEVQMSQPKAKEAKAEVPVVDRQPIQVPGQGKGESTHSGGGQAGGQDVMQKKLRSAGLNPQFSFDRFVVGQSNEFAQAACVAVASAKQAVYNPLFIHGGSGLGKTHLMQAIGQRLMKENPSARVVYLTCEKFINEFIEMVRKGGLDRFRRKYRRADILLIDDVQFLAGKERSQEEFFHTFNELLDLQSQVVLTSDRPASEIKNVEPRLISRFECGLTVELQPPGMETRLAILQRKMEDWDVSLGDDILTMLSERIQSNVRRLEGGLVRVATFASLGTEQITVERAEFLLKDILREEGQKRVNIDSIQKAVSKHFDLRLADMTSRRRPTNIAFPRQIAMYLSRKLTPSSLVEIGDAFGGRDHGTVIYACKKVKDSIESDVHTRDSVDMLITTLQRK